MIRCIWRIFSTATKGGKRKTLISKPRNLLSRFKRPKDHHSYQGDTTQLDDTETKGTQAIELFDSLNFN